MERVLLAALCVTCFGCSDGTWSADSQGQRQVQDLCAMSQAFDVVARVRLQQIGSSSERVFSPWPNSKIRLTELRLEVEDSVRGQKTGPLLAQISARSEDGRLVAYGRSNEIGERGWVLGTVLDGVLLLHDEGLARADDSIHFDWFGVYPASSFAEQFKLAEQKCPRTDMFSK